MILMSCWEHHAEQFRYNTTSASRKDFPTDDFEVIDPGDAATATATGNKTYSALTSVFGRLNYFTKIVTCLKRMFVVTVLPNLPADIVSMFLFSAAWRISEESFFSVRLRVLCRTLNCVHRGQVGNQSIDNYLSMSTHAVVGGGTRFIYSMVLYNH